MKKITLSLLLIAFTMSQSFAQGAYIEFRVTGEKAGLKGTSKVYYQNGNTRSEINVTSPQMPVANNRVSLSLKSEPGKSFVLNEADKTYTEIDISQVKLDDESHYEITVIGKEKMNGYNSTHIKMKKTNSAIEQDVWVSTEVPNYKQYMSVKSKYTSDGFYKALNAKGVSGFPVRMLVEERNGTMQVDLVKSELRTMPASMFSLDGYQKGVINAPVSNQSISPEAQEMMKKMQSMTPEERVKFVEEMRKKQAASKF